MQHPTSSKHQQLLRPTISRSTKKGEVVAGVLVGSLTSATLRHQTKGEKRMRLLITNLLATAMVLFGAMSASAATVNVTSDYAGGIATVGTLVNVTLTLDAPETGIQLLGVNVAFDNTVLQYNAQSNASVGVPSYILYNSTGMPMVALYAQQDPWQTWPFPPEGQGQVNVNFADPSFAGTQITGSGIKIADLEYEVIALGDGTGQIEVFVDSAFGGILQVNGIVVTLGLTGTPITLNLPEPSVGMLSLGAILSVAILRRRAQRD